MKSAIGRPRPGAPPLFRMRATRPGELIELDREHMLALVQTDAELGEILMRAFILRRVELVTAGMGVVVLVGSSHSAGTLRIKEFLMRNSHPYSCIDIEHDPGVQKLLDHIAVGFSRRSDLLNFFEERVRHQWRGSQHSLQ